MANFGDFDVEIQDIRDSDPEHFNGTVALAGTPNSLTPTSTKKIQLAFIQNPSKGPNANGVNDVLLLNIDGGTTYISLTRGESIFISGIFDTLKIDTDANGTNYEVILWS